MVPTCQRVRSALEIVGGLFSKMAAILQNGYCYYCCKILRCNVSQKNFENVFTPIFAEYQMILTWTECYLD